MVHCLARRPHSAEVLNANTRAPSTSLEIITNISGSATQVNFTFKVEHIFQMDLCAIHMFQFTWNSHFHSHENSMIWK